MIIDIIIILLLVFSAYSGYKKGLIGILISFLALILAIILGFVFKEPIANFLYESTSVGISIEQTVSKVVNDGLIQSSKNENIKIITDIISNQENQTAHAIEKLPKIITMFILKVISFILILIFVYFVCRLLQMLLNLFFSLPVISNLNKLGGAGINVLQMLLKIWIVLALVYYIMPIQKTNTLSDLVNNTIVTRTLYENNFFVSVIETNIKI